MISDDGVISKDELKSFYKHISGITDPQTLERTTNEGYRALTAVSSMLRIISCRTNIICIMISY